ncbi:Pancreatic triacylglycerol lipase [Exaiptasia diaphana]|nr:Pancreatic triacylglycerol lipase [Exaiptasia diaphana]
MKFETVEIIGNKLTFQGWVDRPLPETIENMGTKFFLYTKKEGLEKEEDLNDNDANKLQSSNYDGTKKTFLIIHGWKEKPMKPGSWLIEMKDALLEKEKDANVIIVSWQEGANFVLPQAIGNTRLVGAMVAEFIKFLNAQTKTKLDLFHVIGFSLGAQVAGYAGKRLQTEKIGRITGLDPASPGFQGKATDVKLAETDAVFVDVIHTDSDKLGTPDKSGKFDFWPNGGISQPGCKTDDQWCSHTRAYKYFIASIKISDCYRLKSVDNSPEMGYNAIKYEGLDKRNFYLFTNDQPPYCIKTEPGLPLPKLKRMVTRPKRDTLNLEDMNGKKSHFKKKGQFDNL